MDEIQAFFAQPANLLGSTIVAAIVSTAVAFLFRLTEMRHRLEAEYRYEQRKKLRHLVGKYQGRLLNAGNSLNYRLWNLYSNQEKGWLNVEGAATRNNYYYLSFVYRFLNFCTLLREFENEAIVIDSRIGTKTDLQISNLISALRWCLTDVDLFKGINYDLSSARDHFFSDELRLICDKHRTNEGEVPDYEEFCSSVISSSEPKAILVFFDGLSKEEEPLRWDRLVSFHLLLMGLLNLIGHSVHKTGQRKITGVVSQFKNRLVFANLLSWLPRHEVPRLYVLRLTLAGHSAKIPNKQKQADA